MGNRKKLKEKSPKELRREHQRALKEKLETMGLLSQLEKELKP